MRSSDYRFSVVGTVKVWGFMQGNLHVKKEVDTVWWTFTELQLRFAW